MRRGRGGEGRGGVGFMMISSPAWAELMGRDQGMIPRSSAQQHDYDRIIASLFVDSMLVFCIYTVHHMPLFPNFGPSFILQHRQSHVQQHGVTGSLRLVIPASILSAKDAGDTSSNLVAVVILRIIYLFCTLLYLAIYGKG
jgi:hypothetical protein